MPASGTPCCAPPPATTRIAASTRTAIARTEVAGFLLLNTAFPRSVGLSLAQLEWHLTKLRTRYYLRGAIPALERLDQLNAGLTHQNVAELVKGSLSPFLDFVQREIASLHADIIEGFCGGGI